MTCSIGAQDLALLQEFRKAALLAVSMLKHPPSRNTDVIDRENKRSLIMGQIISYLHFEKGIF